MAAELLNDRVLPLFEAYEMSVLRMLTDSDELQKDLDDWLHYYNYERTHQGKMCCGRTPMETFLDGKKDWQLKVDSLNLN